MAFLTIYFIYFLLVTFRLSVQWRRESSRWRLRFTYRSRTPEWPSYLQVTSSLFLLGSPSVSCGELRVFIGISSADGRTGLPLTSQSALHHLCKGATCSSGAIWGSVSYSRTLQHAAGVGIRTSNLTITRRPALPTEQVPTLVQKEIYLMNVWLYWQPRWWVEGHFDFAPSAPMRLKFALGALKCLDH